MDKCKNCGAALTIGATDCAVCGTEVKTEPPSPVTGEALEPQVGWISNIFQGNHGLPTTYWIYGGSGFLILNYSLTLLGKNRFLTFIWITIWFAFQIFIYAAVWRAAGKYAGNKVWSLLARLSVIVLLLTAFLLTILFTFIAIYPRNWTDLSSYTLFWWSYSGLFRFVSVAVWRAAGKYPVNKVWSLLARLSAIAILLIGFLGTIATA